MKYTYEGAIRQFGDGVISHPGTLTRWFVAGTFTVDMNTIFGPAKVGPRPFCADAEYLKPVE
jgi:hypothetical protein